MKNVRPEAHLVDYCDHEESAHNENSGVQLIEPEHMEHLKKEASPKRFSERFHIFALSETFDVDAFLAQSSLHPDFVWRKMGNGPTNGQDLLLSNTEAISCRNKRELQPRIFEKSKRSC